jgi:quercetin dioxygenase-like cupin family protein
MPLPPILVSVCAALLSLLVSWGPVLAQDATPVATPAGDEPTIQTLFDVAVNDLPTGMGTAAVIRWTLEPGPQPLVVPPQDGPIFFVVESGELTATEAGTEHRLAAGDVYVAANPDQEVAFRVSGSEEATLLSGYVTRAYRIATWDPRAHHHGWLIEAVTFALPGGSGRLVLERLTLPPGSALPSQEANPLSWVAVWEGSLGLTLEGQDLPAMFPSGEERTFRSGQLPPLDLVPPGTPMTLRNAGEDPLVLNRLTLTPATTAGTAGTPPTGTPVS